MNGIKFQMNGIVTLYIFGNTNIYRESDTELTKRNVSFIEH